MQTGNTIDNKENYVRIKREKNVVVARRHHLRGESANQRENRMNTSASLRRRNTIRVIRSPPVTETRMVGPSRTQNSIPS